MGTLESGIFGNIIGKVGHLSFQSLHNCNVAKTTGGNTINNSSAQLLQQAKLLALQPLIKACWPLIDKDFFEYYPRSKSHWDIFMRINLKLLNVASVYSSVFMSAGRLQQPLSVISAYQPSTGLCGVNWSASGLGNNSADDMVFMLVYSPTNQKAWITSPGVLRSAESTFTDIGLGYDYNDLKTWLVGYGYRNGNHLSFDSVFSQPVFYP